MRPSILLASARRLTHRALGRHDAAHPQAYLSAIAPAYGLRCISPTPGLHTTPTVTPSAASDDGSIPNPVIQRYMRMVESGSLQQDAQQWALVQELGRLYDETVQYKARMDDHHRDTAEYQARRLERLQQLLEEDRQREERERQQAAATGSSSSSGGSWASWLRSSLQPLLPAAATSSSSSTAGGSTALSAARQAAARREEVLAGELGPPPTAPEPPKGMYVWGSVGSGKSLLVALFYQALTEAAQLPYSRWMHFNAAMLEVHSRLHHIDSERWRLRDERLRQQQQQQLLHASAAATATAASAVGKAGDESDEEDDSDDEEEVEVQAGASSLQQTQPPQPPTPWDPRADPEVARQREARAAMLAVRRHMRLAKLARSDPRTLAAANAQGMLRAAASFIRGRPGDPLSGWGPVERGPVASLLYFDEVQVTDVFSAVALKGLVEALTSSGCVVVATSNRAPEQLPRHGLHEDMWGHFVGTLLQRCTVHELSAAADYRRTLLEQGRAAMEAEAAAAATLGGGQSFPSSSAAVGDSSSSSSGDAARLLPPAWPPLARSYLHPAGPDSEAELGRLWRAMLGRGGGMGGGSSSGGLGLEQQGQAMTVPVLFGRSLHVPRSSPCGGAAWFGFGELCARPMGPADYVALAQRFHTVFVSDIPAMSMQVRDQARRFITLIDELYNSRCVLVASAAVPPEQLFTAAEGAAGEEPILDLEGLQFESAVEDARLRRDTLSRGGVAPVAASPASLALTVGALGGAEERFAFRRAVSRLLEMQSPQYIRGALAMRGRGQQGQVRQGQV